MGQEIQDIIAKSLPAQVGEVLKKRLEQADRDKARVEQLSQELDGKKHECSVLNETIAKHHNLTEREKGIEAREVDVSKREKNIEVIILQSKLEEANKRAELVTGFTHGLVRNVEVRKSIYDSESQAPFQDSNGNWHYPQPTSKSHTETQTKE